MDIESADDGTTPARWLVVCDCAGEPAELITVIDDYRRFTWFDGSPHPFVEIEGIGPYPQVVAERTSFLTHRNSNRRGPSDATTTVQHAPCGLATQLNPGKIGELLDGIAAWRADTPTLLQTRMFPARPSKDAELVATPCISLKQLCDFNARMRRGTTRPRRKLPQ